MSKKENILEQAKDFHEETAERQQEMREKGIECLEYVAGEQWDVDDIKNRESESRPRITINKLAPFVNQVTNKHAMNRNKIKVIAYENADKKTGRVINGLVRHIQFGNLSHAEEAYRDAFSSAVTSGYGFWRVSTVYCDEMSFDQEIIIEKIEDINSVYINQDDEDHALITEWISKDEFEERYPDVEISSWDEQGSVHEWISKDEVMIGEYWVREKTKVTIYQISLNTEIEDGEVKQDIITVKEDELKELDKESYEILQERETDEINVKQYILSADEILEENEWAGKYIPIIGIYGKKFTVNGKLFYKSLVYDGLDAQRMYNFERSEQADMLSKQPKAPWIGVEGQFDGHEEEFQYANVDNAAYLEYRNVTIDGKLPPAPQRQMPPQITAGYVQSALQAVDEIKSAIGMYDASLGNTGNETSGRAILARQQQGDVSTDHFNQSFNEGLKRTGLIVIDLIPHIYDTERTIRILGDDMQDEIIQINTRYTDKDGKAVLYDVTTGKYDVRIDSGPASSTRRMDTAENLLSFAKVIPGAAGVVGDLIAQNMEFDNAEELGSRLKAMIDPMIFTRMKALEEEEKTGVSQSQKQMKMLLSQNQKMQLQSKQMMLQSQGMQKKLVQLAKENKNLKESGKILDNKTKIEVAQINAQTDIQEEQIRRNKEIEKEKIRRGTEIIKQKIKKSPTF